jgi:calcineurin-like phosphoesterase family protein
MKNHFATSDWHIGHAKSIEFDKRPFKDLGHMHAKFVENFNKTVPVEGITYHLGDVGMRDKGAIRDVINALNGTQVLVLGNHDDGVEAMLKLGFDVVLYGAVFWIAGQKVTMSHCPLTGLYREPTDHFHNEAKRGGNWHGEAKNVKHTFANEGQFHCHGHIHSGKHTTEKETYLDRQMDVGIMAHHYRPVSFSHIESWIMKTLRAEARSLVLADGG